MKTARIIAIFSFLCASSVLWGEQAISVTNLSVENLHNPLGLDTNKPRFGWQIMSDCSNVKQQSYHILIASDSSALLQDKADLWDSGIVASEQSLWIDYAGNTLGSNRHAYWKVKITASHDDGKVCESTWSPIGRFSTGLLSENRWNGRWIGLDQAMPWDDESMHSKLSARYLRKEFSTKKSIKRATVFIAGLGLYELYINGKKVGNDVLTPAPTDYRRTVLYNTYDVTDYLTKDNAIGVILGNGRYYTMCQYYKTYKINNFGYPKLRLNLVIEYNDGSTQTIASDTDWKLTPDGPIRSNNEYDGEIYDARKELGDWALYGYDDSAWLAVQRVGPPYGTLRGSMLPNMKIWNEIRPISVKKSDKGFILDFGQNMAGWVKMNIYGNEGDTIRMQYAERLTGDGTALYTENFRDALSTDIYVCNGKENGKPWVAKFSYHGFRYVEVSGYSVTEKNPTDNFIAQVVSDEMNETGTFSSSNDMLNRIYRNARWGILGNYKGMPIDCPQRNERQPWLGDRTMGCWGESYIFGIERLYTKWVRDICEAQREDGCIPDVAPAFWNYYTDDITWPAALFFSCEMLYTQYGNIQPIKQHYPAMQKWVRHIQEEYTNREGLITKDKYGDWCVPPESPEMIHSQDPARKTDGTLIASAYFYKILKAMAHFARLQERAEDVAVYEHDAEALKKAFNSKFLMADNKVAYYGNNTVTANILPLAFDMIPQTYRDNVEKNIITTIVDKNNTHISCGVIGVQWLFRELCNIGRGDIAFHIASQSSYPSYGYMVEHGATTIWELWNGDTANPKMNSGNHVMLLGDLLPFCYERLGGIQSSREQVAFKHIVFKPDFTIEALDKMDVSYKTPYGVASSQWNKKKKYLTWNISVPANTTAEVHLPNGKIEYVGSGSYSYKVKLSTK